MWKKVQSSSRKKFELSDEIKTRYYGTPPIHRVIERNHRGRDFVIGDLCGCYDQLSEKLKSVRFDASADRLFSVGNVINYGPSSFKCLRLVNEPWFFSVLGNHELMMIQALGIRGNGYSAPRDFFRKGGEWYLDLSDADKEAIEKISRDKMLAIPLRLTVQHPAGDFDIVHAQFFSLGGDKSLPDNLEYSKEAEEAMLWKRTLILDVINNTSSEEKISIDSSASTEQKRIICIEPTFLKQRRLTYVGHTVVPTPILSRSHLFIDTGAYLREKGSRVNSLTMIEHGMMKVL